MSKNILDNLFGSKTRTKILKFLFRNSLGEFTVAEMAHRIQESPSATRQELKLLKDIGVVKKRG